MSRGDSSPQQCCQRANLLQQAHFTDAYKLLSHQMVSYSEFLAALRFVLYKTIHFGLLPINFVQDKPCTGGNLFSIRRQPQLAQHAGHCCHRLLQPSWILRSSRGRGCDDDDLAQAGGHPVVELGKPTEAIAPRHL